MNRKQREIGIILELNFGPVQPIFHVLYVKITFIFTHTLHWNLWKVKNSVFHPFVSLWIFLNSKDFVFLACVIFIRFLRLIKRSKKYNKTLKSKPRNSCILSGYLTAQLWQLHVIAIILHHFFRFKINKVLYNPLYKLFIYIIQFFYKNT